MKDFIDKIIEERTKNAKVLAKKFPELKGLSFGDFCEKLPMELDFVTTAEMFEVLNKSERK